MHEMFSTAEHASLSVDNLYGSSECNPAILMLLKDPPHITKMNVLQYIKSLTGEEVFLIFVCRG